MRDNESNGFQYFEDIYGSDSFVSKPPPAPSVQPSPPPQPRAAAPEHLDLRNVLVYEPTNFSDVEVLIDYLKSRQPAIVNLDNATPETAQRVLDFTSGAIYALSGSVVRISGNIFLLSPEGVGITFPKELTKK